MTNNTDNDSMQTTNQYAKNKTIDKHSVYISSSVSDLDKQTTQSLPEEIYKLLDEIENQLAKVKEYQSNLEKSVITLSILLKVYNKK